MAKKKVEIWITSRQTSSGTVHGQGLNSMERGAEEDGAGAHVLELLGDRRPVKLVGPVRSLKLASWPGERIGRDGRHHPLAGSIPTWNQYTTTYFTAEIHWRQAARRVSAMCHGRRCPS